MATDEQLAMAVHVIANGIFAQFTSAPIPGDNAYEEAVSIYNNASTMTTVIQDVAKRLSEMAEQYYDSAIANLRQYETKPGVPLPEYRGTILR